jgi:Tol biopolymer transport system component
VRSTWIISALILAVIGLAIPVVRHLREVPSPPPPAFTLTLGVPPGMELGSGDEPLDAAISPDQRHIVFVAARGGTTTLWRRALQSDRAEVLAGTEGAQLPAWNRTGNAVLFFAGGHLRQLALHDGKVTDIADAAFPAGTTSLLDGSILFAPNATGGIRRLQAGQVTDATTLRPGDRAHMFPFATGTGNDFVYTAVAENGRRTVRLVHDREERVLSVTSGHGQIVGGYLLVVRDDVLLAQRVEESGALGRSISLIAGVGATTTGRNLFVASPRIVLSAASSTRARELAWFDISGMRMGTIGESADLWQVRLAPDDQYAAVTLTAPLLRTLDIAIVPASGTQGQPLTLALAADSDPVWSPDGRRVVFKSFQTGRPTLFMKRVHDQDADDETVVEGDVTPTDWRKSGIVAHTAESSSGHDVVAIDATGHTRATIVKSGFNDTDGRWSPDGSWIAYVSDESGRQDIYVHRRDDDRGREDSDANRREGPRVRVSFGGGTRPRWSRDGRSIFFLRGSTIMRATLTNSSPASFAAAVPVLDAPGIRDFDVAHQRDALLAIVPVSSASFVPVSVMVDWQSTLPSTP